KELHRVYLEYPGAKGILKVAVNSKDHVNEYIYILGLRRALSHDSETKEFVVPDISEVFTESFIQDSFTQSCNGTKCCEVKDYPHDLTGDEWKLSYYREDSGFNDFHGSWHFDNKNGDTSTDNLEGDPSFCNFTELPVPLIHGEISYYFHNQLVARIDSIRILIGMKILL
ncbi:unnamed protein product, partial [Meganyctiphanes norvegica]